MYRRIYEVSWTNDEGDAWTFGTDDRDRAQAILAEMQTDTADARLVMVDDAPDLTGASPSMH
jgi:hypothetical protein